MAEKYERKIVMTHNCNKQGESPKDSLLGSVRIGASFEDRLIIQKESLSKNFQVNAWTDNKTIMAIQHKELPLFGVQFHPESIATDKGKEMLKNFLNI